MLKISMNNDMFEYSFVISNNTFFSVIEIWFQSVLMNNSIAITVDYQEFDVTELERLIDEGYDVNKVNVEGLTLLHRAINIGCIALITRLVNNGADVNANTKHRGTPLIEAINCDHTEIVKILVDAGAAVNTTD